MQSIIFIPESKFSVFDHGPVAEMHISTYLKSIFTKNSHQLTNILSSKIQIYDLPEPLESVS